MKRVVSSSLLLAIPLLLLLAFSAAAGQGPQSAGRGAETPQVSVDVARALAIADGGKLVVAGVSRKGARYTWAIARYRADGTLDPSFGSGGRVLTQFGGGGADALAVQQDGKLLVAGEGNIDTRGDSGFALARYTVRGRLDPSFGGNGRVLTAFARYPGEKFALANAISVAVEADGKIVAAGWSGGTNAASFATLVRYTSRGKLDPSFGRGGKVVTALGSQHSAYLRAAALQPDGKIVALGTTSLPSGTAVVVVRFTSSGELDPSFGEGGQVAVDAWMEGSAVLVQPDGKIVVAGTLGFTGHARAALARYTAEGKLDPSFGSGGKVTTDHPEYFGSVALAPEPDGGLIAAGSAAAALGQESPGSPMLARYTKEGSLDPSFGQGGTASAPVPFHVAALQADGKLVTAGSSQGDFVLARYTGSGSPDSSFGSGGSVVTAFGPAWRMKLVSLSATRVNDAVVVRWRTASAFDARGFYVYREQNGIRQRTNRALLRAKGAGVAASYSFRDRRARRSTQRYWLQEVTVDSNLRWFGPVTVRRYAPGTAAPERR
jgi:uncharacterized delta-60 repeat protein